MIAADAVAAPHFMPRKERCLGHVAGTKFIKSSLKCTRLRPKGNKPTIILTGKEDAQTQAVSQAGWEAGRPVGRSAGRLAGTVGRAVKRAEGDGETQTHLMTATGPKEGSASKSRTTLARCRRCPLLFFVLQDDNDDAEQKSPVDRYLCLTTTTKEAPIGVFDLDFHNKN